MMTFNPMARYMRNLRNYYLNYQPENPIVQDKAFRFFVSAGSMFTILKISQAVAPESAPLVPCLLSFDGTGSRYLPRESPTI